MACVRNGLACYDGSEIWNVCRTMHYVDTLLPRAGFSLDFAKDSGGDFCCGCCTGTFTTPTNDEAPWYNAGVPESGEFYGFFPTVLDGLMFTNPTFRPVEPGRSGAHVASRNDPGRTIDITLLAFGATCEAVTWGVHWLNAHLEGFGSFMWEDCCVEGESDESVGDALTLGRNIPCVSTTVGITSEPWQPNITGDLVWEVTFTLTGEQSWVYDTPMTLFDGNVAAEECVEYTAECIDGAAIEVLVNRASNTSAGSVTIQHNPAYFIGAAPPATNEVFRYGVTVEAERGDSVLVDPRCLGVWTVGPTGVPLFSARNVSLTRNAFGPYGVIPYGETWWTCVTINSGGAADVLIRAWPRRHV